MSVLLSPVGNGIAFLSSEGIPLVGGKIYTYQAGSSTPLDTYTDVNGTIANTNPIILGTDGRTPNEIWLTYGYTYKFVIKDASDVTIQTLDNLYGILQSAPASAPTIPTGCIILWSGASGSIPSGYYLCDGNNGTPDLRNRFIVGAGDAYSVNQTGGSADAIVVTHTHTATSTSVVTDPGHTHSVRTRTGNNGSAVANTGSDGGGPFDIADAALTKTTGITVATTTTNANAGTSGTNANLPPYFALCYIMKS
jgi:microcystin-dependent protein